MAYSKQQSERDTVLDLAAEIRAADGDTEALASALLERAKEFETASGSLLDRSKEPSNISQRAHLVAKSDEAKASKERCNLIVHTLMHRVPAPDLSTTDWKLLEKAFPGLRKR
jgi:hypothetical protein